MKRIRSWVRRVLPRKPLAYFIAEATQKLRDDAARSAAGHPAEQLPGLPYTERNPDYVLLRRHVAAGQIEPEALRRMRTRDLEYLAGMTEVLPTVLLEYEAAHQARAKDSDALEAAKARVIEEVKVAETAIRATRELDRRATRSTEMLAGFLVTVGAAVLGVLIQVPKG